MVLKVAKPIPSYQVYKGTVFDLVDQAKDFVLSKIDLWVGTRAESTQVPTKYEIPQEVVAEAIVNAVVHRDYTSNASVQVMLFKDRLEVWNPGTLPPTLTLEKLRGPHASIPHNPLIAEPMYLTKYIERMGTGIRDMIQRCRKAELPEPEFRIDGGIFVLTIWRKTYRKIRTAVTEQVRRLLLCLERLEYGTKEIMQLLRLSHRPNFLYEYIQPALKMQLIEMTHPESPRSPTQKYRLTAKGHKALKIDQ